MGGIWASGILIALIWLAPIIAVLVLVFIVLIKVNRLLDLKIREMQRKEKELR